MDKKVYILVLNWNSHAETQECLQSLETLDYSNCKIVIIDNGSTDQSEEVLRKKYPQHFFIQTGKNLGYGGGNNYGIRYALKEGAEFIWILNPDMRVGRSTLKTMIDIAERNPKIGILAPVLLEGLPPHQVKRVGRELPDFYKIETIPLLPEEASQEFQEVDYMWGCSMMVRSEIFKSIGLIREDFFLYSEDIEFNLRSQKAGWKSVVCLNATDEHRWNKNKKRSSDSYYYMRNEILLARLQGKSVVKTIWNLMRLRRILYYLKKGQAPVAWEIFKEIHWLAFPAGLFRPLKMTPPSV